MSKYIIFFLIIPFFTYANVSEYIISKIKEKNNVAILFEQGESAMGEIVIKRPSNMKITYHPPSPFVITLGKKYLSIYDFDMEQISRIESNNSNIYQFFLRPEKLLAGCKVKEEGNDIYAYNDDFLMHMKKAPFSIIELSIYHPEPLHIRFIKERHLESIPDSLFIIKDPEIFGAPKRKMYF